MLFCALELMACILLRSGEKGGAFPARMLTACLVLTGQGDRTGIHRQSFHVESSQVKSSQSFLQLDLT